MNTFAVLLLAFPFYIAVSGRLLAYTDLVKPSATTGPASGSMMQNATFTSPSDAVSASPSVNMGVSALNSLN